MAALSLKRRKKVERIVGRDRYFIRAEGGPKLEARHHAALMALIEAQGIAQRATKAVKVEVIRVPLLGGSEHVAYRVVRNEDGHVLSYTEED